MQPFETWLKADLQAPVTVKRIDGNLFSGDNQGNLVGVTVTDAGEPATLSGEVRGYFIRSDGNTVIMSGTIDGNKVTVVLPSACYTGVGQFSLVIKVGQVAVGACTGYVYQSNTDSTVDPEHVIPDIDQLLTRVEALEGRATTLEGDVSAQNNTINAIEDGLAIIADGNTHPSIPARGFVFVKNHSTLTTGLYRVTSETTAIGTNAPLSLSNLTLDSTGGLNALKSDLDSLNSNITNLYALNRLYQGTVQTTSAENEITLTDNWNNYRMIIVVLLSASDLALASTTVPTEYIEVLNSNVYTSYYSDLQTVVYTNFNRTNKNKVNVWSNNSNAKKIQIWGMIKKF